MKISIDMDGVLTDFVGGFRNIQRSLGRTVPDVDPNDYDFKSWNLTKEQFSEGFKKIKTTDGFWEKLSPYKENVTALRNFIHGVQDQEIFFTTSRATSGGASISTQTRRWLDNHELWSTWRNYTTVLPVVSAGDKVSLYTALGITHSIDDYGPTVLNCENLKGHQPFLLDRSWNREYIPLRRVSKFQEFLDAVKADLAE